MSQIIKDRWTKGLIRHLAIDENHPTDSVTARRVAYPDGSSEIFYTLQTHPANLERAVELRNRFEMSGKLGGLFSPELAEVDE